MWVQVVKHTRQGGTLFARACTLARFSMCVCARKFTHSIREVEYVCICANDEGGVVFAG